MNIVKNIIHRPVSCLTKQHITSSFFSCATKRGQEACTHANFGIGDFVQGVLYFKKKP